MPSLDRQVEKFALRDSKHFSFAIYKDAKVFLTGGKNGAVVSFDLISKAWRDEPPLYQDRFAHSSITLGENLYVIGGFGSYGSIEFLNVTERQKWQIAFIGSQLTMRASPAVAVTSEHTIAVFGGQNKKFEKVGFEFDARTAGVVKILGAGLDLNLESYSPLHQIHNENFALGRDEYGSLHLAKLFTKLQDGKSKLKLRSAVHIGKAQ